MKQFTVTQAEAGQRLDKFLGKYLNKAPKSFLYKMMRKKNITLNGKKAAGSEKLVSGDEIKLFFSDETIEKFSELQLPEGPGKALCDLRGRAYPSGEQARGDPLPESRGRRYLHGGGGPALSAEQRSRDGGIPPNLPPVGGKPAGPEHAAASWLWEKTWRGPRS